MIDIEALGKVSYGNPLSKIQVKREWLAEVHRLIIAQQAEIIRLKKINSNIDLETETPFPSEKFDAVFDKMGEFFESFDDTMSSLFHRRLGKK